MDMGAALGVRPSSGPLSPHINATGIVEAFVSSFHIFYRPSSGEIDGSQRVCIDYKQ